MSTVSNESEFEFGQYRESNDTLYVLACTTYGADSLLAQSILGSFKSLDPFFSYEEMILESVLVLSSSKNSNGGLASKQIYDCMIARFDDKYSLPSHYKGSATQALKKMSKKQLIVRFENGKYAANPDFDGFIPQGRAKPNIYRYKSAKSMKSKSRIKIIRLPRLCRNIVETQTPFEKQENDQSSINVKNYIPSRQIPLNNQLPPNQEEPSQLSEHERYLFTPPSPSPLPTSPLLISEPPSPKGHLMSGHWLRNDVQYRAFSIFAPTTETCTAAKHIWPNSISRPPTSCHSFSLCPSAFMI